MGIDDSKMGMILLLLSKIMEKMSEERAQLIRDDDDDDFLPDSTDSIFCGLVVRGNFCVEHSVSSKNQYNLFPTKLSQTAPRQLVLAMKRKCCAKEVSQTALNCALHV